MFKVLFIALWGKGFPSRGAPTERLAERVDVGIDPYGGAVLRAIRESPLRVQIPVYRAVAKGSL